VGGKDENGVRHQEAYYVSLESLNGTLWIHEGDKDVQYHVTMSDGRGDCLIERRVFDPAIYGRKDGQIALEDVAPVEHRSALLTLDQLRGDAPHDVEWARSDAVVWAARGLWGVPLRFKPKEEEPSVVVHSTDVATGETKAPPRRTPNRSAK
jgi:hypothetical protein